MTTTQRPPPAHLRLRRSAVRHHPNNCNGGGGHYAGAVHVLQSRRLLELSVTGLLSGLLELPAWVVRGLLDESLHPAPPRPPPPSFFWFVTFLRVTSALSTSWTARTADRCDHPPSLSRFRASDVLPPPSSSIVNLRSLSTSRGALTQMVAVLRPLGYSNCEGAARILGLWDPTRRKT